MSGDPVNRMFKILRAHQAAFLDGIDLDSPARFEAIAGRVPGLKVSEIHDAAIFYSRTASQLKRAWRVAGGLPPLSKPKRVRPLPRDPNWTLRR